MKITLDWIEQQEERNFMAAKVTIPSQDFAELLHLAKRGLGPRIITGWNHTGYCLPACTCELAKALVQVNDANSGKGSGR